MDRQVVIVTGLSGSGKSTVAETLEDAGFFCVDNIPVDLLPKLLDLTGGGELDRLALVIDLRQREFVPRYNQVFQSEEVTGAEVRILFVEARDEVLVRRYSETRRQHPFGAVVEGIRIEREGLREIREKADWVFDTSDMNVHQLKAEIRKLFGVSGAKGLRVSIRSFGFGRGLPVDADLVFDVRFLPNPYFVEELKAKDGRDPSVADWINSDPTTKKFIGKLEDMLLFLLPLYIREGKQYLTIAVGCTGGRHRSVAVGERIFRILKSKGYDNCELTHRELKV